MRFSRSAVFSFIDLHGTHKMNLQNIPVGVNIPWDVNVIIEISTNGPPVKYEFDKDAVIHLLKTNPSELKKQ